MKKIVEKITKIAKKTDKVRIVPIESLREDEEFKALYKQEEDKVRRIADDMAKNGYDKSQPLIVLEDNTIIDGHSRFQAAVKAGVKKVPVIYKDIGNRTEVLTYMEHLQLDRRNLTDAEKVKHYENLMRLKEQSKANGGSLDAFSVEKVATQLNISPRQVNKIREIEKKATDEQLSAIKNNEKSINQIHSEIKKSEGTPQKTKKWDFVTFHSTMELVLSVLYDEKKLQNASEKISLIKKLAESDSIETATKLATEKGFMFSELKPQ